MTSVFTYKSPLYKIYKVNGDQKKWIKLAIEGARKVGYSTALYTDSKEFAEGLDIDEVHFISDDYTLWDSFKIYVLENRKDNDYFLCDNDCIFSNKIEFSDDIDLYFDGFEKNLWGLYLETLNILESKGLFDYTFWNKEQVGVTNLGILKINNQELKNEYIKYWKKSYSLVDKYKNEFSKLGLTATISQLLLTRLMISKNNTYRYFTTETNLSDWGKSNKFYKHNRGVLKLKNLTIL